MDDDKILDVKAVPFRLLKNAWKCHPPFFRVQPHEVHVWKIPVCCFETLPKSLKTLLTDADCAHLEMMRSEKRRREYTVSRSALKCLAGKYLHVNPQMVDVEYQPTGRPGVVSPAGKGEGLNFAWSHSHELLIIAIAHQVLGVDIERASNFHDHPRVKAFLKRNMPHGNADVLMLSRYWTACEALYKLRSTGTLRGFLREDVQATAASGTTFGYHLCFGDYTIAIAMHSAATISCYSQDTDDILAQQMPDSSL